MTDEEGKYKGLENLDVGAKFKMFEEGRGSPDPKAASSSSDRYGIMEKLKRLQEGEDLDALLAEIEKDLPSPMAEEPEDLDEAGMTEVQKKVSRSR